MSHSTVKINDKKTRNIWDNELNFFPNKIWQRVNRVKANWSKIYADNTHWQEQKNRLIAYLVTLQTIQLKPILLLQKCWLRFCDDNNKSYTV